LNAPEQISAALPRPGARRLPTIGGPAWWCLALAVAGLTARLTMESIQLGAMVSIVILTVGLYVRHRTAALAVVWVVWLIAPFLRRIFLLSEPIQQAEPLALAPFLVTAAVITLDLTQVNMSRRSRRLMLLVLGGYCLGLPLGLLYVPSGAAFAFFAYLTAVGCFVLGYREAEERTVVLPTVLMIVAPVLAAYAFAQYYLPLPEWDHIWQRTADINTVGSPESGRIRVWSTLNSPGTFSVVLGIAALALLAWRRLTPARVAAALVVLWALALTYVRSAWAGIAFALVGILFVSRGRAIPRVGPTLLVLAALAPVVVVGSTGAALGERFNTFGSLSHDTSAKARTNTPAHLVPIALGKPIGTGLGTAGEATRLSDAAGFKNTDNGYLSLISQVGPVAVSYTQIRSHETRINLE
jgi:putative inorganic carbon (HCO3(-)) transporter